MNKPINIIGMTFGLIYHADGHVELRHVVPTIQWLATVR